MIRIKRSLVPTPRVFFSRELRHEKQKASQFYSIPAAQRDQPRFDWKTTDRLLRSGCAQEFSALFHHKCAYCESHVEGGGFGNLEFLRPRNGALGLDGSFSPDHYWWLTFEWANCFAICSPCDLAKAQRFPVLGTRAEPHSLAEELKKEKSLLLDPCRDSPEKHLLFGRTGLVSSNTRNGQCAIEVLALNRELLVHDRLEELDETDSIIEHVLKGVKVAVQRLVTHLAADARFLAAKRQLVRRRAKELRSILSDREWALLQVQGGVRKHPMNLGGINRAESSFRRLLKTKQRHSVEDEGKAARRAYFSGVRRIERIEIRNFKKIRSLELTMLPASNRESWLVFLGENATGKSSLLQAIGLSLLGRTHLEKLGLDAKHFVTRGEASGYVKVHLTNVLDPIELHFDKKSSQFRVQPSRELVLLLGYGATRLLPRSAKVNQTPERYVRVKNLFDPYARLQHAERWLTDPARVSDVQFSYIGWALKKLLLLQDTDTVKRKGRKLLVEVHNDLSTVRELSDGYQSMVALAVDIMMGLAAKWERMDLAEGVVLIDEIEMHLHPVWKLEIVSRLRKVFPRLQFFATTHDPLCLRGLSIGEIVVLRNGSEGLNAEAVTQDISHLRADQLLTSPLFGLVSTRDPGFQKATDRYSELLGKGERTLTKREKQEVEKLRGRLSMSIQSGQTPGERSVEHVIRQTARDLATQLPEGATEPGSASIPSAARKEIRKKLSVLFE